MKNISTKQISDYVDKNIIIYHDCTFKQLKKLKLNTLLKRKNPYLFKAKNVTTAGDFVKKLLDAYLSSREETTFGYFLEQLAIFVNKKVYGGTKSPAEGLDLDFTRDGNRYLVSIKSGPNWGNSDQIKKMKQNFSTAKKIVGVSVICVNGCSYGKRKKENMGTYIKKCGQSFWEFISGRPDFYKEIIKPLGIKAKEKNEQFNREYGNVINIFTKRFIEDYCKNTGEIDWEKIVEFNSQKITKKNK